MVKRSGLPELNELVFCTVKRITPYAAWVTLDEYSVEGMIHISEVTGKWIHDIREFVKPNKQYVAKVVRIDTEKNIVNLSLKRVSKKEEKEKMNIYRREQRAEKILEQSAKEINKNLEQAYKEVGYLLQEKFGELFVAFEEIRKNKEVLEKLNLPEQWVNALVKIIEKSFKEKVIVLKADIELKSYAKDGMEKIKTILSELEKNGLIVKYISAPRYRVELETKYPKFGEKKMKEQLEMMVKQAKQIEGEINYKLIK